MSDGFHIQMNMGKIHDEDDPRIRIEAAHDAPDTCGPFHHDAGIRPTNGSMPVLERAACEEVGVEETLWGNTAFGVLR
mgnify:CR=1 FL=1